jgi:beta-lactamase superfamily II metal-dependent hydrolase
MPYGIAFEFLDIGMGDATLVQLPPWESGGLALVDFGEKGSPYKTPARDATKFAIKRISEVWKKRDPKATQPMLDWLFISHADGDHWNKLGWLIEGDMSDEFVGESDLWHTIGGWPTGTTLKIDTLVYGGSWTGDFEKRNADLAQVILDASDDQFILTDNDYDAEDVMANVTPRWTWEAGVPDQETNIYLLSSNLPQRSGADCNPKSLVLLFDYKGFKVILTGDAESKIVEKKLVPRYEDSKLLLSNVLKLGHHGSAASTSAEFVEAVQPKMIFASGDRRWGHPYCDSINRGSKYVTSIGSRWYACSASGSANDYTNQNTAKNINMNLWYVVTDKPSVTKPDVNNVMKTAAYGTYVGAQWRLQVDSDVVPHLTWANEDGWPKP